MADDKKLDLIMKMITENREEMRSEFENINNKLEKVDARIDNLEKGIDSLKEDVDKLKEYMIIIKGQNGHLTEQNYIVKGYLAKIIEDFTEVKKD